MQLGLIESATPLRRWDCKRKEEKQEQGIRTEHPPHARKQAGVQHAGPGGGEPERCPPPLVQGPLPQLPGKGRQLPQGAPLPLPPLSAPPLQHSLAVQHRVCMFRIDGLGLLSFVQD